MPISYRDLDVWKVSILLIAEAYRVTAKLPPDERFGLTAQIRRSAVSIACNIAEGYGRATRGEYLNQLSVARGSLNELETLAVWSAEPLGSSGRLISRHSTDFLIAYGQCLVG